MQFLNKEIEHLARNKKSKSLVKRQISCGIFQDLGDSKLEKQKQPAVLDDKKD